MKIAVARKHDSPLIAHFGRAEYFMVVDLDEKQIGQGRVVETRNTVPPCNGGGHDVNRLDNSASIIADCEALISSGIGPGAISALVSRSIYPFVMDVIREEDLPDTIALVQDRVNRNRERSKHL